MIYSNKTLTNEIRILSRIKVTVNSIVSSWAPDIKPKCVTASYHLLWFMTAHDRGEPGHVRVIQGVGPDPSLADIITCIFLFIARQICHIVYMYVDQDCQGLYNFSIIVNGNEYVVHDGKTCSKSQRRSLKLEFQHRASCTQGQKGKYKGKYAKL